MLISGRLEIGGVELFDRDAIGIEDVGSVSFRSVKQSRMLLIEVPMS